MPQQGGRQESIPQSCFLTSTCTHAMVHMHAMHTCAHTIIVKLINAFGFAHVLQP